MTPILLVPGLLCTADVFASQITALWPYGTVTVANTLGGETVAEIVSNILAAAPPRFALAGISMGGYLCFEIVRQAPERVERLALLDTSARPDTPEQSALRRKLLEALRDGAGFAETVTPVLRGMLAPSHREDPAMMARLLEMAQVVGPAAFARQTGAIIGRPDSRPLLSAIRVPTLVLAGEQDALMPPEVINEMADAIPGARRVFVPDCGHHATIEQPGAVNAALVGWLR